MIFNLLDVGILGYFYSRNRSSLTFCIKLLLRCVPERNVTSDPEMQKKIAEDPLWYKGGLKLNMGTLLVECVKVIEGLEFSFS